MQRPQFLFPGFLLCAGSVVALGAAELSTDYTAERALVLSTTMSLSMETVESRFEVDGEPMEGRGRGGGGSSEERRLVIKDRVLKHRDGSPTQVRRSFEEVEGERVFMAREEEMQTPIDSPFAGVVLELTDDEGEISYEIVDGDEPDEEHFQGQLLTLTLDALLPEGDVSDGDTWSLESDAIKRALMLDVQRHLFPRPEREEGQGEGGRRGGGRRGGFGGGGGGSLGLLINAEFEGDAELVASDEEGDDGRVARLRFEAMAEGEVEDQGGGGGRGGEGETTYSVSLEGELVFSVATRRPVTLEVKGTVGRISDRTFDRNDSTMSMYREESGAFEMSVEVSEEPVEEDDE